MNWMHAARRAVAMVTIVGCTAALVVRDAGASLAVAVETPAVADQGTVREPSPLTLALEDDGASLVARGTGDDPAQPVVIQADDGAILATCVSEDECRVELDESDGHAYIARAGDSFSEPVLQSAPGSSDVPTSVSDASRATLGLPAQGEETSGTSNGWTLTLGTRPVYQNEPWDENGALGHVSTGPTYGSTAWYAFYATATPPSGVDVVDGDQLVILDRDSGELICVSEDAAVLAVECSSYGGYEGAAQHDIVARVVRAGQVIAELAYDGWYDRYFYLEFWPTTGGVFEAGDPITLRAFVDEAFPWELYSLYLQETTTGEILATCDSSPCVVDASPGYYTGVRAYRAFAADPDDPTLHVAASTSFYTVSRVPWSTSLWQYGPVQGGRVPVIATTDQDLGKTGGHYKVYIVDLTIGTVVKSCSTGRQCVTTVDASRGHTYTAIVASSDGPGVDVQAVERYPSTFTSDGGTMRNGFRWETSGGFNPSIPSCQSCAGDPVNTYTGEFWDSVTDLALGQLSLSRSYGSTLAPEDQGWGHGWSSPLGMRLEQAYGTPGTGLADAQQLVVIQENGSFVPFARTEDGFATAQRVQATLVERADETYAFARKDGLTYVFSATGELAQIVDRNDNTRTLTYADGRVSRIADDRGRHIDLTWTDGHVTAATDSSGRTVSYAYDAAGDLVAVTAADGAVTTYEYDTDHRVVAFSDARGARVENVYQDDRVVEQTDALDRVTTFDYDIDASGDGSTVVTAPDGSRTRSTYDDGAVVAQTIALDTDDEATTTFAYIDGLRVSTTDPTGATTTFTYDARGNTTSVTDPLARTSTSTYDAMNLPLVATDAAGSATTTVYDERGNTVSVTDATGAATTYTVNPDGTVAASTDPLGRTTWFTYDSYGNLAAVTDPAGATTTTDIDALGRVLSLTDARGGVTTYAYDAAGRVVSTTDAGGGVTTATYDQVGNRLTVTAADGAVTSWEYDLAGQLTATVDAAGARTTYDYDPAGRVATVTNADGAEQATTYDAAGRLDTSTDALDRTTTYTYDDAGRLISSALPSGATTGYAYDAAGQQTAVTDPLGAVSTTTYDAAGRPITVTDADGRAVTSGYDAAGRLTSLTRGDGSVLEWSYDGAGQQTAYTDAAGAATEYTYDTAGRTATRTDTAGRVTTFAYDSRGNLTSTTAADGTVTARTYDALSRVTGIDYATGTPDVTYAYDTTGRRTSMVDGTGTTTYTYDGGGRPTQISGPIGTVGYSWDDLGQMATLTYPDGTQVTRTYDDAGQLATITDWDGGVYDFTWTDDGQQASIEYPNGVTTTTAYDDAGQVTRMTTVDQTDVELLDLAYGYSDVGLQTSTTTSRSGTADWVADLTWDAQSRLNKIAGTLSGDVDFSLADHLTTLPGGTALAYDTAGQLTTATTGADVTNFGYDTRGNRTSQTGANARVLAYDGADRVVSIEGDGAETWSYAYDGDGLRSTTTLAAARGAPQGQQFVWDRTSAVSLLLSDSEHSYLYGLGTAPLAQRDDTGVREFLHGDALGSIRTVTDTTAAVIAESNYEPYGSPTIAATSGSAVADVTRFGFAGEYTDATGLVYLRARYYDPSTGQFVSVDPAIDATRSMYGYTNGNPLQFVDPLGLEWWEALIDSNDESLVNNALQSFGAGVLDFFMNAANSLTRMTGSPAGDPFELIGNPNACDSTYDWSYKLGSLTTVTAVTVGSFGGSGSRAASGAADDSMAGVRATGIAGEQAAGIVKNTQRIPSLSGTANYRIPDELTATAIGEVKNVAHLSYTAQLKDFNLYAQQNGMAFNLYVRESTTFSSALRDEIAAGHINVIRLLM